MKNSRIVFITLATFVFIISFGLQQSFAQVVFGAKGGTSIKLSEAGDILDGNQSIKNATFGLHAGLFARLNVLGLVVQPEATISTNKDLDVPILAGFKLGPLRAMAGPMLRFDLDRNADVDPHNHTSLGESMKIGFQAGAGFDISKFTLDFRYESSLSGITNNQKYSGVPSQLLVSAGFKF